MRIRGSEFGRVKFQIVVDLRRLRAPSDGASLSLRPDLRKTGTRGNGGEQGRDVATFGATRLWSRVSAHDVIFDAFEEMAEK